MKSFTNFLLVMAVCAAVVVGGSAIISSNESRQIESLTPDQRAIVLGQREASRGLQTILFGAAALMLPVGLSVVVVSLVSMFRGNNINAPTLKLSGRGAVSASGKSDAAQMDIENMPAGWMDTFPQQQPRVQLPPPQNQYAMAAPMFEEAPPARVLGGRP